MRLPVRQPVTQYARLNPLAGAVAEIRRGVMKFTGSQSVKLTPSMILSGDFEIIWTGFIPNQTFGSDAKTIFYSYEELNGSMGVDVRDNRVRWYARSSAGSLTPIGESTLNILQLGKINTISLRRQGTTAYLKVNEATQSPTSWAAVNTPLDVTYINARGRGANTPSNNLSSQNFGFQVYLGGDSNTGNLVLDLPIDNATSDYQRNMAVPEGLELVTNGDFSDELNSWTPTEFTDPAEIIEGKLRITYRGVQQIYEQLIQTEVGKRYLLKFTVSDLSSTWGFQIGDLNLSGQTISGELEFLFTATENNLLQIKKGGLSDTSACYDNISVREFLGGVMKNTLPGDWKKIKRQKDQNFWTDSAGTKLEIAS